MDVISVTLHVCKGGLSPWEGTDILEFLSFMPLLSTLFYHLYSFRHPKGMPNTRLCFLYGLSLPNKDFIFILDKFWTFTNSIGSRLVPTRGREAQSNIL